MNADQLRPPRMPSPDQITTLWAVRLPGGAYTWVDGNGDLLTEQTVAAYANERNGEARRVVTVSCPLNWIGADVADLNAAIEAIVPGMALERTGCGEAVVYTGLGMDEDYSTIDAWESV